VSRSDLLAAAKRGRFLRRRGSTDCTTTPGCLSLAGSIANQHSTKLIVLRRRADKWLMQPIHAFEVLTGTRVLQTHHNKIVSRQSLHNWRVAGIRGERLEAVRLGHGWYTTHEALDRMVMVMRP